MKISVITVCLNSVATIRRALESVRRQTYRPVEVIIIDGVSTDDTLKVVSEFKDIVTIVVSEKDKGIYDAMNKGVSLASGDIVYFLNSDDELMGSNIIADAIDQFQSNDALDMLYGDVIVRHTDSDQYRTYHHVNKGNILHTGICHQAVFVRRSLFDKVGAFNLDFRINADFDWFIRVHRASLMTKHFPRIVSIFHAGGASMSDQNYNLQERRQVQRQYETGLFFWAGHYRERIKFYLSRLFGA